MPRALTGGERVVPGVAQPTPIPGLAGIKHIAAAFLHFGGVVLTVLGDNARALVRDRATGTVTFHPGYLAFCRDWDVQPRACAPYRARTKGKVDGRGRSARARHDPRAAV